MTDIILNRRPSIMVEQMYFDLSIDLFFITLKTSIKEGTIDF